LRKYSKNYSRKGLFIRHVKFLPDEVHTKAKDLAKDLFGCLAVAEGMSAAAGVPRKINGE